MYRKNMLAKNSLKNTDIRGAFTLMMREKPGIKASGLKAKALISLRSPWWRKEMMTHFICICAQVLDICINQDLLITEKRGRRKKDHSCVHRLHPTVLTKINTAKAFSLYGTTVSPEVCINILVVRSALLKARMQKIGI